MKQIPDSGDAAPADASPTSSQDAAAASGGRKGFLLLVAALISVGMGQTLMFALLPPVARNLGLSEVQVGAIFAVSAVLWVVSSPFWGRRSDVWGRRPVILIGFLGYAVSMAAFGFSVQASLAGWLPLLPAYLLMVASRSVYGLFGSASVPAAQAYVAERTQPEERAAQLALQAAGFGLGVTLGPGVVSVLLAFGLVAPFYAVAAFAFLGVAAIRLRLPEQTPPQWQRPERQRMSPWDARVLPYMLVAVALGIGQATAMQTVGFYAIDVLGMPIEQSARWVGLALMGSAAAGLFVQLVIIRLLRLLPRTLMVVGSALGLAGFGLMMIGGSFALLFAAMVLLGASFGMVRPATSAGASLAVRTDEQGAVAGLMNTTGAIGFIFAPLVGMSLYQLMPRAPYLLDFLLMGLSLALALGHPALRPPRQPAR